MYLVTVIFEVSPDRHADFMAAVRRQASDSLRLEPACQQFDVSLLDSDGAAEGAVFLYELYDDRAAFDEHLASDHFARFNTLVTPWTLAKTVRCGQLVQGTPGEAGQGRGKSA